MPRRFPDDEGFDKVNFIIDSWTTGCNAPWYIYVETMKPAALRAFLVLLSFGWADVLRGRLRPKGLGRRTSKRKGRWNRRIPRFPEIGNTIGKSLPFGEQLDDFVKWGTNTRFLWRIDNLMQAGLFWWLVVDVVEDFVFNWTSLLYESYWCQPDPPGRFSYNRDSWWIIPGNTWYPVSFPNEDYEEGPPVWTLVTGYSGPNGCTAAVACAFEKHPAGTPSTSFQVKVIHAVTGWTIFESGVQNLDAEGKAQDVIKGSIPPNTQFVVRAWTDGTWGIITSGVIVAVEEVNQ